MGENWPQFLGFLKVGMTVLEPDQCFIQDFFLGGSMCAMSAYARWHTHLGFVDFHENSGHFEDKKCQIQLYYTLVILYFV